MTDYRLIIDLDSQLDREATVNMVCNTLDAVPAFELEACYHRELDQEETEPDYPFADLPADFHNPQLPVWACIGFVIFGLLGFMIGYQV